MINSVYSIVYKRVIIISWSGTCKLLQQIRFLALQVISRIQAIVLVDRAMMMSQGENRLTSLPKTIK